MVKRKDIGKVLSLLRYVTRPRRTFVYLWKKLSSGGVKWLLPLWKIFRDRYSRLALHHKIASVLGIAGITIWVIFFVFKIQGVIGATYTFTQTDWSGGVDTASVPVHPGNQTGWSRFNTSTNISVVNGFLQLSSSTHSTTDDGTLTTDGVSSSTNGGFYNGAAVGATVTSTGANAYITITGTSTILNTFASSTVLPVTPDLHQQLVRRGSEDYVYEFPALPTNNVVNLYRYSISGNSWTKMTDAPCGFGSYLALDDNDSTSDYIYTIAQGCGLQRYSISGNSWTTLSNINILFNGYSFVRATGEDNIYIYTGVDGGGVSFFKYSISSNTTTQLANFPVSGYNYLLHAAGEDYIYAEIGDTGWYRYSISGNSWTVLTASPQTFGYGDALIRNGTDDLIYAQMGNGTGNFYKYSISGNSWTALTGPPLAIWGTSHNNLLRNGVEDAIYSVTANNNKLLKYSISGNNWTQFTIPSTPAEGSVMVRSDVGGTQQIFLGNGQRTNFYKFTIQTTVYNSSATFTSAPINLAAASYSTMTWTSSTPSQTGANALKFQVATSTDGITFSSFTGPTGTASYFTSSPANIAFIGGSKFFKYKAFFATADTAYSPTLYDVLVNYRTYSVTGTLISSIYDTADATNVVANLKWNASSLPSGATVKFQMRSGPSTSSLASANWMGTDGTNATYFTNSSDNAANIPNALKSGADDRYLQYQAFLASADGVATPILASTTFTYVVNASPEVQNQSATQNSDGSVTVSYQVRDLDTTTGSITPGFITPSFKYWNGSTYVNVATLNANATSTKAVNSDGVTWTSYSATWYPQVDYTNQNTTAAKIQITIDDREAANNTVVTTTPNFALDTTPPSSGTVVVDASTTPATIFLNANDSSALQYKLSLNSDLSGASFTNFASSTTLSLSSNPATVYAQFKDAFTNTTSIYSATTPESPTSTVVQDVSNVNTSPAEYRLFLAWKIVAAPTPGFGSYKVWRSTNQTSWLLIGTVTDRTVNYFMDATVASSTIYYYKIITYDSAGNGSYPSSVVNGRADGIQNAGEGGGGSPLAPAITNVATSTITPSQVTMTWDTDVLSNSQVSYSTTAGQFTTTVTVSTMVNSASGVGGHSVILSGLSPNTTYYLRAGSTNATNATGYDSNGGQGYAVTTINGPTITTLPSAVSVINNAATITWGSSAAADSVVFFATNTTFISASSSSNGSLVTNHSVTLTNLTPNTKYYYYVRFTDGSSHTEYEKNIVSGAPQYYQFTTTNSSQPPVISNVVTTAASSSVIISWTTDNPASSQVEYGLTAAYGTTSTLDAVLTTRHSVTITGLTPSTLYHFRVRSTDANSLLSIGSDTTFVTLGIPDTTPPIITSVATSSISLNQATITWLTDKKTNATVDYGTSTNFGALAGNVYDFSTNTHSVTLSNLLGNTTYYFRVNSMDALGNSASSSGYSFRTVADVTPPGITNIIQIVNQTAAIITWTTNEQANSRVDYGLSTSFASTTAVTSTFDSNHSIVLSNLEPNTTYYYRVRSTDPSGNAATDDNGGGGYTFTTFAVPDTALPVISNVASSSIAIDRATITWDTDKNTNATVDYGTDNSFGSLAGDLYDFSKNAHRVSLTNLLGNTQYFFRVNAMDAVGNIASSTGYTFTTAADVTPPHISAITDIVNQRAAFVNWNTDEQADSVVDYGLSTVYTTTIAVTSTFDTSHTLLLSSLIPSTTYYYRVRSTDPSGNATIDDNGGAGYVLTTLPIPDTTPPTISNVATSSIALTRATLSWTTDKYTNGTVDFGTIPSYGSLAGSLYNFSSTTHSVTLTDLLGNTLYYFRVNSADTFGNTASSSGTFITLPDVTPPLITATSTLANDTAAFVNWRTDEQAIAEVDYGTTAGTLDTVVTVTSTFDMNHSLPLTGLIPETTYYFRIISADPSANTTTVGTYSFVTLKAGEQAQTVYVGNSNPAPDYSAPTLTNVSVSGISAFGATISWNTDQDSNSLIRYGSTATYGALAGDELIHTQTHAVTLVNLRPGTRYHFKAESFDPAGNLGASDDMNFTTLNVDGTAALPNTPSEQNDILAQVSQASQELVAQILEVLITNPYLKDVSQKTLEKALTEMTNKVVTAPVIVGTQPVIEAAGTTAVVRWSTDKLSSSGVSYAKESAYNPANAVPYTNAAVNPDEISTVHHVELTGLTPGTLYHFQVVSKGAIGPEGHSPDYTFRTTADLPTITDLLIAKASENSVTVNWKTNMPTVTNVEYTNLKTNKVFSESDSTLQTAHTYIVNNLESGTRYSLIIKATSEGGATGESLPIQFSTTVDTVPPLVSNITSNSTLYPGQNSKVQTIISWDTDEPATAQVYYQEGVILTTSTLSSQKDTSLSLKHIVVLTNFKPGAVYKYWVESQDATGNLTKSDIYSVLAPIQKQTIIDIIGKNFQGVFGWTKNLGF